jgi:hypothetical protein
MHWLPEHVSIVHALLSLHKFAISVGDLSILVHPVLGLHEGALQMSSDVHSAPILVASHDPKPVALHVYVVHSVLPGHAAVLGTSAQ